MLPQSPVSLKADEVRGIALGEMERKRRRLGELTPEQERALRSLVVTVADNIFSLVAGVTLSRVEGGERNRAAKFSDELAREA